MPAFLEVNDEAWLWVLEARERAKEAKYKLQSDLWLLSAEIGRRNL